MLLVTTHTDHTFAHANLDILEMDAIVQVQSIILEAFRFVLTIMMNFCLLLLLLLFFVLFCFDTVENQVLISVIQGEAVTRLGHLE